MLHNELKDISNRIDVLNKEIDELTGGAIYTRLMKIDQATFFSWKDLEKYLQEKSEMKDDISLLAGVKVAFKHLDREISEHKLGIEVSKEASKANNPLIKISGHIGTFFANRHLKGIQGHLELIKEHIGVLEERQKELNPLKHGILTLGQKIGLKR